MADGKSKKSAIFEMLDQAVAEAKAAAATGVNIAVPTEPKTGNYIIRVDMTAPEQNPTPGQRSFGDKEDISLQLKAGENSTDRISTAGQKIDFNLSAEVKATMIRLLGLAEQGDHIARTELGDLVKTTAHNVLQTDDKSLDR